MMCHKFRHIMKFTVGPHDFRHWQRSRASADSHEYIPFIHIEYVAVKPSR